MWDGHLGKIETMLYRLDLQDDARPMHAVPYRTGHKMSQFEEEEIYRMLAARVIEQANTEWTSPIAMVWKKDCSLRFSDDYRNINEMTVRDSYQNSTNGRMHRLTRRRQYLYNVGRELRLLEYVDVPGHEGRYNLPVALRSLQVLTDAVRAEQHPSDLPTGHGNHL